MARAKKYPCKDVATKIYEQLMGGEWWAEWQFHPERRWRFDYALPELKIAIEIDGGLFTGGRHSGGIGQLKDLEKMNEAASRGWLVFHYTPEDKFSAILREQVSRAIEMRKMQKSKIILA